MFALSTALTAVSSRNLRWAAGLALGFVLILATNLIDRRNFQRVGDSVATMYEDRVVAAGLVYDMGVLLTAKRVAVAGEEASYFSGPYLKDRAAMEALVDRFAHTRLTVEEEGAFRRLKVNLGTLEAVEDGFAKDPGAVASPEGQQQFRGAAEAVSKDLQALSRIQTGEGRRQQLMATKTMGSIEMLTRLEMAFLVAIGITLAGLVLYRPRRPEA